MRAIPFLSRPIICFFLGTLLQQCQDGGKYAPVLKHFRNDPPRYAAAEFLVKNMHRQYTLKEQYLTDDSRDLTRFLGTYGGDLTQNQLLDSLHASLKTDIIYDGDQVSSGFLISAVEEAFQAKDSGLIKLPVSFDDFCEYLLPYRVGTEQLDKWRPYFQDRYRRLLKLFGDSLNVYAVVRYVNIENGSWYLLPPQNSIYPSITQNLDQVLQIKTARDCSDYTYLKMHIFRALGIPAAYETIPLYGKFNYGHAESSVLFENGRFYPAIPDTTAFKYMIAKMYRRSYSMRRDIAADIVNAGEDTANVPVYFRTDNLVDITRERTDVSDIRLSITNPGEIKVFYICVYNNGQWQPVEWGKYNGTDSTLMFRDMGRKIIYQVGYMVDKQLKLYGEPFILDTAGNLTRIVSDSGRPITITVQNYDRHHEVSYPNKYSLFLWNASTHVWKQQAIADARAGSVSFNRIPSGAIYKVEPKDEKLKDQVRVFTYQKRKQIWW